MAAFQVEPTSKEDVIDGMNDEDTVSDLLVIVLDTNPSQRLLRDDPEIMTRILECCIALGNAHLMQKVQNKLAVISCHHHATDFLYPMPGKPMEIRQIDGQYEKFTLVEETIKQRLSHIMTNAPKLSAPCESQLAGSVAMALCYIHRLRNKVAAGSKLLSRILVVSGSNECASQYMVYMNTFFTAHKEGVVLDVCSLDKNLTLLQQGCDITGGIYMRCSQLDGLMEYLLWVFLPEPHMRQKLVLPPQEKVDYRAACFCHRELIDIGYVCSVCLSVFCKFTPICTTCQAVFELPAIALAAKPKKRKK